MRRTFRKLLNVFAALCLLAALWVMAFYFRSGDRTDVFMFAGPADRCLLLTSHEGRWMEITWLDGWPDRGVRWWSAARPVSPSLENHSWNRAGPFRYWQGHRVEVVGPMWHVRGRLAVPTDDGGKLPAYGDGYARADRGNVWTRGVVPGQPGWVWMRGWELRAPHPMVAAPLALLGGAVLVPKLLEWRRRRARAARGLCPSCGYDRRGSAGACPECGSIPTRGAVAGA